MKSVLKYGTVAVISFGPFLDETNGVTLQTGLVSALDHGTTGIMLSKNGGALAVRHASVTASTYDAHGCYRVTLDITDTGTLGSLRVIYTDAANVCPVWQDFEVVPAVVYDAMVAGSDLLDVSLTQVNGAATVATLDTLASQISAIGSGTGAALNFAVDSDNESTAIKTIDNVGTQTGTFANTMADDGSVHTLVAANVAGTFTIDWIYGFTVGAGRAASKFVFRANMASNSPTADTVTVSAYNFVTPGWDVRTTVTGTAETLRDIPLLAAHTGFSGADTGKVYIRFQFAESDTGSLVIDEAYVQAQQSGSLIGYAGGSVWVKTGGTAAEVPYVNGTADNPAPWANALVIAAAVGLERFTIAPGTAVVLDAAFDHRVMTGRSYDLDLGADPGNDVHKTYVEGAENLTGVGTCAGGEAIFVDCQVGTLSIDEVDMVRCHWMGAITMTQDAVPYRFHDCTGITGASIIFTGSGQVAVISHASGVFSIGGMQAGNVLYLDGDCVVELLDTCDGGTVYCSGNVLLTNNSVTPFATVVYGGATLANGPHGGAAATFATAAGVLAQEDNAGVMDTRVSLLQDRMAFASDMIASGFQTFDWQVDAVLDASYSEEIPVGMELAIYIESGDGVNHPVGTLTAAGFAQDANAAVANHAGVLFVHPGTNGGQLFPAGTLTVTADLGANFTGPRSLAVDLPAFTGNQLHFVWDRYGVATLFKVGRYAIEAAATSDTAAIAAAVRDVPQLVTPVAGSLGADVADAAGGGGGGITPEQYAALAKEATVLGQFGVTYGLTYPLIRRDGVINVPRGDVFTITATLGAAFPLAGRTAYFTVQRRKELDNATAIVNRAMTVADEGARICTITLTEAETAIAGKYLFEIEVRDTSTDANPSTAEAGTLNIIEDLRK